MNRRIWRAPDSYHKTELDALIVRLNQGDEDAIEESVAFVTGESFGIWHGRARAHICRNLKNIAIEDVIKDRLVECICQRLVSGNFSQQFKDQLMMALRFRPARLKDCAELAAGSSKDYVRRYAAWVAHKLAAAGNR